MTKLNIPKNIIPFFFVGPILLVIAGLFALLAMKGLVIPLGRVALTLETQDLAGLSVLSTLIGVAFILMSYWVSSQFKKENAFSLKKYVFFLTALIFIFIILGLAIWPAPLVRLSFEPQKGFSIGQRFFLRGFIHGQQPLLSYQKPFLVADPQDPSKPYTCDVVRNFEFGPLGWSRFVATEIEEAIEALKRSKLYDDPKDPPIPVLTKDLQDECTAGIKLSGQTKDPKAAQLLRPFVFDSKISFDYSEILAAEGKFEELQEYSRMTSVARYIMYLKNLQDAEKLPGTNSVTTNHLQMAYNADDILMALYACDLNFARFLTSKGVLPNENYFYLNNLFELQNTSQIIDSSHWSVRIHPFDTNGSRISLSKKPSHDDCQALFRYYTQEEYLKK